MRSILIKLTRTVSYLIALGLTLWIVAILFRLPLNLQIYAVYSGSMEPIIPTGAAILVRPQPNYTIGDVVTYQNPLDPSDIVTHRIVDQYQSDAGVRFITQGDANEEADQTPVALSDIQGKQIAALPTFGYLARQLQLRSSWFLFVILPSTILILMELAVILQESLKLRDKQRFRHALSRVNRHGVLVTRINPSRWRIIRHRIFQ